MEDEADAADAVKQDRPLLVIIGNPPYNAYAGVSPAEEKDLVKPYKDGLQSRWGIKKFNLDDLYVRFFRVAERRIAKTGQGIVSFISNFSFTTEDSFVVMRENWLKTFDKVWVENLHGNRNRNEYTPDRQVSETIFAQRGLTDGIRQGVVISTSVKTSNNETFAWVGYRDDLHAAAATDRREQLLASLTDPDAHTHYDAAALTERTRLSFKSYDVREAYVHWPGLADLAAQPPVNGLMEKRGGALIDVDVDALKTRMKTYLDPEVDLSDLAKSGHRLALKAARFDPKTARANLLLEGYRDELVVPYLLRPFETPSAYNTTVRPIWNETRPVLQSLLKVAGNSFVLSRPARVSDQEGVPLIWSRGLFDNDAQRGHAYGFPSTALEDQGKLKAKAAVPNVSPAAEDWLASISLSPAAGARSMWRHVLAIGHSPAYLEDNDGGLAKGWPRIPLPASAEQLNTSAALGERLEGLIDPLTPMPGVTAGVVSPIHRLVGALSVESYRVAAGWGYRDSKGRVGAGQGQLTVRDWNVEERQAIALEADARGIDFETMVALLGGAVDVHLNREASWRAVPQAVWDFHIGGYQVLKKWLSYREHGVLGRDIKPEESKHFRDAARRLTEIVLMGPELDTNYQACADNAYPWPVSEKTELSGAAA